MTAQHMRALEKANATRLGRPALRKRFQRGEVTFEQVVEDPLVQTVLVMDVLAWNRRCGERMSRRILSTANKVLDPVPITEYRRIGDLTERQRVALVAAVATWRP